MKYIDVEKLISEIERRIEESKSMKPSFDQFWAGQISAFKSIKTIIASLQQEQPEENKLPSKRTRVNYAICKLQAFKHLREAIVLDDYVYDENKCYRENLLNYIHAIPENRLTEIRHYLKEKGRWPYDDDADWMEQEQLGVWVKIDADHPLPYAQEVIGYNKEWVDEDFNPSGTRVGFLTGTGFLSAKWVNDQDCYTTCSEEGDDYMISQILPDGTRKTWCKYENGEAVEGYLPNMPTHFMLMPETPDGFTWPYSTEKEIKI